ncbi:MAG: hypothetical protein Q8N14_02420 [Candidatus Omnitrophota bacterium]|nr:hypothetical protein [Candidatus Omnitrophota bacterium]
MNQRFFSNVTLVVFSLIALLHVLRLVYGWSAVIAGWEVPMWMSGAAVVFFAYLAYSAFKLR